MAAQNLRAKLEVGRNLPIYAIKHLTFCINVVYFVWAGFRPASAWPDEEWTEEMAFTWRSPSRSEGGQDKWQLAYFERAKTEAESFLTDDQYEHAVSLVKQLALEDDPGHPASVSVRPISGFHEIRDKGGVLEKINLRIYFWICKEIRAIVVLGAYKKEDERQTPKRIVARMKSRQRLAAECAARARGKLRKGAATKGHANGGQE